MSRATNSFAHIDITADNATPEEASKIHRKALRTHIQVLIDGLNGSATRDEVERALTETQLLNPPTAMLDVVEIALAEMSKAVVMLGNSQLRAEMDAIDPVNTGQLPQTIIPVVRKCLDSIMLVSEQRLADGFGAIQAGLQAQLQENYAEMPPECITSINGAEAALTGLEKIAKESVSGAPEAKSEAARAADVAYKRMCNQMNVLTEKTYTIKVCRETIQRLETAKKAVAATNKAARRALLDDPSTELPDITEESKIQENIDAEMKDLRTAETERDTAACANLNVQLVHKQSYKVNDDSLKALGKLIGGKLSAHWDATKATEIKTLASRFVSDNIRALNSLSAMSARLRDYGTGSTWRVPTVLEVTRKNEGESEDQRYERLAAMGFGSAEPEEYLVTEYAAKHGTDTAAAAKMLRREQVKAMIKEYIDANEYAYNVLRERMPSVIHQIVLAKGQVMGDSSSEVTNKADEHDYMSVVEQIIISSSTHSVFQADDAHDALRASAGLFMMDNWKEAVRIFRERIKACSDLGVKVTHSATAYKFMLRMRAGNPAAFQHLQLEYAKIPSNDSFQDYLPNLVTMIGKYEYFMNSTRAMDRKLGGSRKERAAVIRQAMAFESEDSSDEEEQAALTTFDPNKKRAGVPLCFRTAKEQQERALKNEAGKRLCEVRGCRKVLSASELAVVAKVQNKSDHRYKGSRFYKAGFEHGPFKSARCDACCRTAFESGVPSVMLDGYKLKGFQVDAARITQDHHSDEHSADSDDGHDSDE